MKQRLVPSTLLATLALVGAACTVDTIESAASPERASTPPAAPPVADPADVVAIDVVATEVVVTEVVVTAPMPPTSLPPARTEPSAPPTSEPTPDSAPDSTPDDSTTSSTSPSRSVVPTLRPDPVVTTAPVLALDPCGAIGAMPAEATAVASIELDADGDGALDTATSYLDGASGTWAIRLATAAGTLSEYEVADVAPGFVEALGSIAFGEGPQESFLAIVGSGASAFRIGLFGADDSGCVIRHGGDELDFAVGGSIGELVGLRCGSWDGGHYLESLSAVNNGDDTYNLYGTTWHLGVDGDLFAENGTHLFGASFDDVESIGAIECPGFGP